MESSPATEIIDKARSIDELADSTVDAFKVLRPWLEQSPTSEALKDVTDQVKCYAQALEHSITAARRGKELASEAVSLVPYLDEETVNDLDDFGSQMMRIAESGEENAKKALRCFRDVRVQLIKVIEAARAKETSRIGSGDIYETLVLQHLEMLANLEKGIPVFEAFFRSVDKYCEWWTWLMMESPSIVSGKFNYNSLRRKIVVSMWTEIQSRYVSYVAKIYALQDTYPELQACREGDVRGSRNGLTCNPIVCLETEDSKGSFGRKLGILWRSLRGRKRSS